MTTDMAHIRALLDSDKEWDALSDEEREARSKRRAILGSLEDTYALTRAEAERGSSEALPLAGFSIAVLGLFLALFYRSLAWWLVGGSLLWVGLGIAFAVVAGRRIARAGVER